LPSGRSQERNLVDEDSGRLAIYTRAVERAEEVTWAAVGEFIRAQRRIANLSLRQLASMAQVSNPYLSQIERGLHRPSAQVLKGIAEALQISAESLYAQAGLLDEGREHVSGGVEQAIRLDPNLTTDQKETLIRVYRGLLAAKG
jgi:transcriptional regulator with XRE-family HTH domain